MSTMAEEEPERVLKPLKSFHKFKDVNKKILQKVRSKAYESVGGSVSSLQSDAALFKDFANLKYDEEDEKLVAQGHTGFKLRNMVRARKHFINHKKQEIARPVGAGDPSAQKKQVLRKMKLVDFPKNPTTKAFLMESLTKNLSFSSFNDEQLNLIIQGLKPKRIAPDVTLLKQGDVGTSFFIVQSGTLKAVETMEGETEPKEVCEYSTGDSFGELSLLYGTKREMTVTTTSLCCLWRLDSMSFKKILAHGEELDFEVIRNQLSLIPLLEEANVSSFDDQMDFLAQNLHHVKVQKGDVLMSKGDEGDMMFFIIKGRVKMTKAGRIKKKGDTEKYQHKNVDFIPGDYFGEGSLIARYNIEKQCERIKGAKAKKLFLNKNKVKWLRSANIFATKDSEFLLLDYDAFKRIAEFNDNSFLQLLQHNLGLRILRTSPFIQRLRRQYQEFLLENLEILQYESEDLIIQQGEIEKILFLVVEGKVEIRKQNDLKQHTTVHAGYSFGEQFFFDKKPYSFDVVACGATKIFAMTLTIFTEIFGDKLTMQDLYKSGDPEVDDKVDINFAQLSQLGLGVGNITAIQKCLNDSDPRHTSRVIKKISENFEIDERNSVVKRKVTSVRAKPQAEEEKLGHVIEAQMDFIRSDTVKTANKETRKKRGTPSAQANRSQSSEVLKKKFKEVGPIGMGTFGMVKFVKSREGRGKRATRYALKVIDVAKVVKLGQQEGVLNEKNILSELCHPFVLKFVTSFKDRKQLYILTELLIGGELFEVISSYRKKKEYMPDDHAIFYAACMVETFSYLHKKNVLYRDIKPENIMIDSMGYTRLVDFGFAKKCKFKTFTKCGTTEYFAPELLAQRGYNKSVDLWGIGILTYEMMTGMSPFYSSNHMEMIDFIMNEDPDFGDDFPEEGIDFIQRLLEKEPNERLGMSLNHPDEIRNHPFLKSIDWHKLICKELPAPFVPNKRKLRIRSEEELRLRLEDDDSPESYEVELKDRDYKGWFEDF